MNKTQAQRLQNVANALEDAATWRSFFTMNTYGLPKETTHYGLCNRRPVHRSDELVDDDCGTPACALGHYASRRDLQKFMYLTTEGDLILNKPGDPYGEFKVIDEFGNPHYYTNGDDIKFDSAIVQDHFGITDAEASELFDVGGCNSAKTPMQAVNYIRNFLKSKGWDTVDG